MSKVLLVGDDWEAMERLTAVAEGLGYEAETILESVDALGAFESGSEIGMVVLQENMPVMNGYEVAEQLRGDPDVPETLPVVLLVRDDPPAQKLEGSRISGVLHVNAELHETRECIVHHMEQYA